MGKKSLPITINIKLPAVIVKKAKWFVSCCPALDVYSQGNSIEEAKKNLAEALSVFMVSCYEMGTLEEVLRDNGFRPASEIPIKNNDYEYIDVPLPFIINAKHPHPCHA